MGDSTKSPTGFTSSSASSSASAPPSSSSGSHAQSIWTSQEPRSGRPAYSPSGSGYADGAVGAAADGTVGAARAADADGAAPAATGTTAQMPGRIADGRSAQASDPARPHSADDLVSKLRFSFGTPTKKRKPPQVGRPAAAIAGAAAGVANAAAGVANAAAGVAATVKSKPAPTRGPAAPSSIKAARKEAPDARRDAQLVLARIQPWSVMKFSFIVSLAGWVVMFTVVALLYFALRA